MNTIKKKKKKNINYTVLLRIVIVKIDIIKNILFSIYTS